MKLFEKLQLARSEEDVKDIYIKFLGLKSYSKNLIDIQTNEIWFEAKDTSKHSTYKMFTQLMHYVQDALNKGQYVPPFLAVIDTEKAAIMKSEDVLPFLEKKTIKWGKSASGYTQEALDAVSAHIGTHFVSFKIETHEQEFLNTIKNAILSGDIIRTAITPDNLKQVFDKWVEMIGKEIRGMEQENYALLFFADIMHDGTLSTHINLPAELLHKNGAPVFSLNSRNYELDSKEGYRQFWTIYHKPPKAEYRNYLLERRDSLIPVDERGFKGAFYTPLSVVDKAYDKLSETLGRNWQKNYIIWDMCCGVGNLEVKHSNHRNIFMSTLDSPDIDVMKATKTCIAAHRFQYDYLNDDINEQGKIDYTLTEKVPLALRDSIASGKKILILINPPYAESGETVGNEAKTDVSNTQMSRSMNEFGYAKRELFVQFIVRIAREMPTATLAMFSTLKYVNSSNFEVFRKFWNAKYLGGFVVHSKAFDGLAGNFPIGFLIWSTNQFALKRNPIVEITTDVLDKSANPIGEKKFLNIPSSLLLSQWIKRPKANKQNVIPLKGAITPATSSKDLRGTKWADNAIACLIIKGPDVQNASTQAIVSSGYGSAGSIFITPENLWKAAVIFAVRGLVKPTWVNNRDQFLQPSDSLSEEFKNDCLIWMLFSKSNLTASADGLKWNDKEWSIVNHFIPFSENEVDSNDRFESDFMVRYLRGKTLSMESKEVLSNGKILWKSYFNNIDVRSVREDLKLNRADVGWYQIRKALQSRNLTGNALPVNFDPFNIAYTALTNKLIPFIYNYNFLKT
ncbi:hypothetical protein [Pedobacter miscanthi]|uniref:hypothetical protein n=1 Tax=Pedobacter miscanthi TaxID=2259170 RepID=UPI00292E572F|nr:hypothetical protein [Pedobacter miscanthi]